MNAAGNLTELPRHAATFLTEVRQELAKVVWPTRQQTIRLTLIVVGVSVGTAAYIGILDVAFTELVNILIGTF
ncbi:MAG: preprotein translocase subunit SecE [Candidatus Chisholmbacteria bacterium]|nr:preprotein translocase subunit SecE [Candidatus Chisholmbacteria bacterium]